MIDILQLHEHIVSELRNRDDIRPIYMIKILPLLAIYKSITNRPKIIYFLSEAPEPPEDNNNLNDIQTRIICVMKSALINAHIHLPLPSSDVVYQVSCIFCTHNSFIVLDRDTYVCDTCSSEYTHKAFETVHSLISTIGGECQTRKHAYDRIQHFKNVIQQFQGKKMTNIPDNLFEDIRQELHTICLTDETSEDPIIKYRHVTKQHILTLLQELRYKYERYYDDIHYIHFVVTCRPRHDISHLEETLMNNFNLLSNTYDKYSAITTHLTRKNFINKQLVLFQLLHRHMYRCDINEFNFIKTYECMETHERICSDVFNILGWKYIPVATPMRLIER